MKKILIVDDEATIATHLEEKLSLFGYHVIGRAASGELAIDMAKRFHPDLILMDIVMPGRMDGIEASLLIKKELGIPVVFLTAYGDDQFIKRAKEVEPFGYIIKPFRDEELKAAVEIALYNQAIKQKLKESEEQWRSLAENIQDGIILGDHKGKILIWNKGAEKIFKYAAAEAIGQPITFLLPEGIRESYEHEIKRLFLSEKSGHKGKRAECVGLRKDWSKFPLELSLTPWKWKDQVFLIGILRDVSEQKKERDGIQASLKEKEALLLEIQNHVQNNLEIIYKMIKLQFEYLKERKSLKEFGRRKDSSATISKIHKELYSSRGLGSIDFGVYLRNLADKLFAAFGADPERVRLKINAADILLKMKTAIPLGMIASELISNSLKYAFPGERKGEISIGFQEIEDKKYRLVVRDNGVGFPKNLDLQSPDRLGLRMVRDLASNLGGTLRYDRKEGARATVSFENH
ncbi:MAG: response regulator [Candidatus Aminicenantales bacterium]